MGVLWTVWPLDEQMRGWLDELEIPYPSSASRFPTGAEIKGVLSSLEGYVIEINDNGLGALWQATIVSAEGGGKGPWTLLNIKEYSGDNGPQKLWFEKGWESLITEILTLLSRECGPLVLIPDTGGEPSVVAT